MKKNRIFIIWIFIACLVLLPSSRVCAEEAGRTRVLVALGDSYTSGEGLEPYFGQDAPMEEKCMNPDWLAHRSEGSWPGMLTLPGVEGTLAEHRGENFFFAAASGAMTRHLFLLTEEEKANGQSAEFEKPYSRDGISGVALLAPQLSVFDELDARGLKADYVVMTISGNDVDFRGIVMMSLFGQTRRLEGGTDVDKGVSLLEQQYETGNVRENIRRVFYDTAFRAGEQAVLLVVGYPCPLVDENAVSIFSSESARIMNEANDFFCIGQRSPGSGLNAAHRDPAALKHFKSVKHQIIRAAMICGRTIQIMQQPGAIQRRGNRNMVLFNEIGDFIIHISQIGYQRKIESTIF